MSAWSPYSLIMDCYKFLGILLKVHYVMAIKKQSMKFIQCDYIIYKNAVLSFVSFYSIIFNHMANKKSQNFAKTTFDNIL
jgi:hypothetical protein